MGCFPLSYNLCLKTILTRTGHGHHTIRIQHHLVQYHQSHSTSRRAGIITHMQHIINLQPLTWVLSLSPSSCPAQLHHQQHMRDITPITVDLTPPPPPHHITTPHSPHHHLSNYTRPCYCAQQVCPRVPVIMGQVVAVNTALPHHLVQAQALGVGQALLLLFCTPRTNITI